jgi:endonuclease/exonuclease/phosphatase family metal-dependent hydrolase
MAEVETRTPYVIRIAYYADAVISRGVSLGAMLAMRPAKAPKDHWVQAAGAEDPADEFSVDILEPSRLAGDMALDARRASFVLGVRFLLGVCSLLGVALLECRSAADATSPPRAKAPAREPTDPAPKRPIAPERQLVVASWNLDWLHRRRQGGLVKRSAVDYQRLRGYATRMNADVVAVQEVDGPEALQLVFDPAEYEYHLATQRDVQGVGFAYRKGLVVERHPDLAALNVGGLRPGADLTVHLNGKRLRLLAIHLKSDCFSEPLVSAKASCVKLRAQLPVLEAWIDERARAGEPFLVLGDFNRRLHANEAFYLELDDGEPPNADLTLLGAGHVSRCWGGKYPEPIDHMLLSRDAFSWLEPKSFSELVYDAEDAPFRTKLSDHCPIRVVFGPPAAPGTAASGGPSAPGARGPSFPPPARPVKGNINARRQKLYHLPGCPSYASTHIDESRGERSFATEAEAIAAGWRRASGCR